MEEVEKDESEGSSHLPGDPGKQNGHATEGSEEELDNRLSLLRCGTDDAVGEEIIDVEKGLVDHSGIADAEGGTPSDASSISSSSAEGRRRLRATLNTESAVASSASAVGVTVKRGSSRDNVRGMRGSLELRRVPEHILLGPDWEGADAAAADDKSLHLDDTSKDTFLDNGRPKPDGINGARRGLLQRTCLRPTYSLRKQLMLSFGIVSVVTVLFVMVISIGVSLAAGSTVQNTCRVNLQSWAFSSASSSARFVSDAFAPMMNTDVVNLIYEATQDRFVGYPDAEGYVDDGLVPFEDMDSGKRIYPIDAKNLSMHWDFSSKVNDTNYYEHVQNRWFWYGFPGGLSTAGSLFKMQGSCNPADKPGGRTYFPNCTDANNNPTTGGVVMPVPTNIDIYSKGKDLDPLFKALYESSSTVQELGVFFANSGAGAMILFPQHEMDHTLSYTSVGCDWMNTPNPLDPNQNIGTEEEIARCQPEGTVVHNDRYNPLERGWCRDQALRPNEIVRAGPFLSAGYSKKWLLVVGKAVYARVTNKFLGCILVSQDVEHISRILEDVKVVETQKVTLARWDDAGTVVMSTAWNSSDASETTTVDDPDLGVGIDAHDFKRLQSIIDFSKIWDPSEVQQKYKDGTITTGKKIISSYPLPPPPRKYEPTYKPDFMVLVTLEEEFVYGSFYDLDSQVHQKVMELVTFTVVLGFVGLAFVICIISGVSVSLTRPLKWMNGIADHIVSKVGDVNNDFSEVIEQDDPVFWCNPHTELSDLMLEFKRLVLRFSGEGSAKAVRLGSSKPTELKNRFAMLDEFDNLYRSRAKFKYDYAEVQVPPSLPSYRHRVSWKEEDNDAAGNVTQRRHFGPNIHSADGDSKSTSALTAVQETSVFKSPLFWWIVGLIVAPLLLLAIANAGVVLWQIATRFVQLDDIVKEEYLQMESATMSKLVELRAIHAKEVTSKAARDLHVLTRFSGWLLFGGLNRSASFTKIDTHAENCKLAGAPGQCDHVKNPVCDCAWNDQLNPSSCQNYSIDDSRDLQTVWWEGQRTRQTNGNRNTSIFANSPTMKEWYTNASAVPGFSKGPAAQGFETMYDRVRVLSATATVQIPLYNYNYDSSGARTLGTYIGLEADGSFIAYSGCDHGHADHPFFRSTEANGAARVQPELCPLGSYGFDVRCRDWYAGGKEVGLSDGAPLSVTPPYVFAGTGITGQSCGLPLIDPKSQEYVGQTLVDFSPNPIVSLLQAESTGVGVTNDGFAILMTTRADVFGHDTVIGPKFSIGDPGKRIEDLIVPPDEKCFRQNCSGSQNAFYVIAEDMRAGKQGVGTFQMIDPDDGSKKIHFIAYAPVNVTSFRPVDASDYSRGVKEYNSTIYSLAIVQSREELLKPFKVTADELDKIIKISIAVLVSVLAVAAILLVWISSRVTMSVTAPIIHLLGLLRNVNRLDTKEDLTLPEDMTGSKEVLAVHDTFIMLFKVIGVANSAFFSGDIERAYAVLVAQLKLFNYLGNEKAIGIANNNLGNCMLIMYLSMKDGQDETICGLSMAEIIAKGTYFFRDAIKSGEEAYEVFYEEQGWSGSCLVFMQHLSNRYFNRAMFFLTVRQDHKFPDEANRLGFRDLDIAKNMDIEVADQCLEVGFAVDKGEQFDLSLSRIRGLFNLKEMDYCDEWDTEELIDEIFYKLRSAIKHPSSDLFRVVTPAGRMQQFDVELMKYARLEDRLEDAARIGIRLLIEDEYNFYEAQSAAVEVLVDYVKAGDDDGISPETKEILTAFQEELCDETLGESHSCQADDDLSLALRITNRTHSAVSRGSSTPGQNARLKHSPRGDITMESF